MTPNPAHLHPFLRPLYQQWLAACRAADLPVGLTFTYRTPAEQDALYAQGRTKPGKVVTMLRGDRSQHCYTINGKPAAKAFDFGCFDDRGRYVADGSHPDYTAAGKIGESLGLRWGGRWKKPFDPGHLELPTGPAPD